MRGAIEQIRCRRLTLITYLGDKVAEGDWHGVSDAANDIRVIEATIKQMVIASQAEPEI